MSVQEGRERDRMYSSRIGKQASSCESRPVSYESALLCAGMQSGAIRQTQCACLAILCMQFDPLHAHDIKLCLLHAVASVYALMHYHSCHADAIIVAVAYLPEAAD